MFGNQNRTLRQRATTQNVKNNTAAKVKSTNGNVSTTKRAVLGDVSNNNATVAGNNDKNGGKASKIAGPKQATKQPLVQPSNTALPINTRSKKGSTESGQQPLRSAANQTSKSKASVASKPTKLAPTDRKTRSSITSDAIAKASSAADAQEGKNEVAQPKRKPRSSRGTVVVPPTAGPEEEVENVSVKVEITNLNVKKSSRRKSIVKTAVATKEAEPTQSRRTSRKNSRSDDIEERKIVAKNHTAKKARTLPHDDLDKEDLSDPMMVSEYVEEIFEYLKELEIESLPNPNYMDNQKELQWKMRGILVDWLIEVHTKFRLLPETLFLAVNIIDRFLSLRVVSLVKLQLVGVTALFIASKYEEVMSPSIQSFLYMAEDGYTENEIIKAERYVLQVLKFNMQYPTPLSFLRRSSKADEYDIQTRTLAKYLMEITLLDHKFLPFTASIIAASAHYLARHMLDRGEWNKNLVYYSGYTAEELSQPVTFMLEFLSRPTKFEAIFKKYSQRKFMKGSVFVKDWIASRLSVGHHPVYDHIMNVEMRAEWIRKAGLDDVPSSKELCDLADFEDKDSSANDSDCGNGSEEENDSSSDSY